MVEFVTGCLIGLVVGMIGAYCAIKELTDKIKSFDEKHERLIAILSQWQKKI